MSTSAFKTSPLSSDQTQKILPPTFAIQTLGCKINQYDSNRIAQRMLASGFKQVPFREQADAYIIDTCTVTHVADRKSRNATRRAIRNNPEAVVAVTGCAAEWAREDFLKIHERALVVGNAEKDELPLLIEKALRSQKRFDFAAARTEELDGPYLLPPESRTRAILKVMEGCNRVCSFCIIPRVRGTPHSRPLDDVLMEARQMVAAGVREIVVTGVIAGWYGTDLPALEASFQTKAGIHTDTKKRGRGGQLDLLLRHLNEIDGLERIRLSTLDPRDLSDELIEVFAACEKVCPYLHLALQAGHDEVLLAMRRGYTTAQYAERVARLREAVPGIALHTDLMVGFPGETDTHFEEAIAFIREMQFAGMHVFPYSARPGTAAPELPGQVAPQVAQARGQRLGELARTMKAAYARRFVGHPVRILVEKVLPGELFAYEGFSAHYVPVRAVGEVPATLGESIDVSLLRWEGERAAGEVTISKSMLQEQPDGLA